MSKQITPLLWHWGGLASRRGRGGFESVSPFPRGSMAKIKRGILPLQCNFIVGPFFNPSSPSRRGHPNGGRIGLSPSPQTLTRCQVNQARAQAGCELARETQELASRYDNRQIKLARRHERQWAQMVKQADATFLEVFSQVSSANSIKLLPWCISSAALLCYMSEVLATGVQQDEGIPATTTASEPEDSPAPGPSGSLACPPRTLPLPVPPLPDIPFIGTPPVGCPFAEFLAIPTQKKQDHSLSNSLGVHHDK